MNRFYFFILFTSLNLTLKAGNWHPEIYCSANRINCYTDKHGSDFLDKFNIRYKTPYNNYSAGLAIGRSFLRSTLACSVGLEYYNFRCQEIYSGFAGSNRSMAEIMAFMKFSSINMPVTVYVKPFKDKPVRFLIGISSVLWASQSQFEDPAIQVYDNFGKPDHNVKMNYVYFNSSSFPGTVNLGFENQIKIPNTKSSVFYRIQVYRLVSYQPFQTNVEFQVGGNTYKSRLYRNYEGLQISTGIRI